MNTKVTTTFTISGTEHPVKMSDVIAALEGLYVYVGGSVDKPTVRVEIVDLVSWKNVLS